MAATHARPAALPRNPPQPWYSTLTIDMLLRVLQNSIFHPFIASLIPLCLVGGSLPLTSPAVLNTTLYALLIIVLWLLAPLNRRLAYGAPRSVSADSEVVVITGGARGLGACLARIFALKGVSVAVVDVVEVAETERIEDVDYYRCDVSDGAAAAEVLRRIGREVGPPTVLINNAGVVVNKPLRELSAAETKRVLAVNTTGQFALTGAFLHSLTSGSTLQTPRAATLVTVSSVLGRLGAANLSAYTASKAALIAYHNSLAAELRSAGHADVIKMILVTPGQLSTDMFAGIRQNPVQRFLGPTVEVQQLALKLVGMIAKGQGGVLAEPAYARWIGALDVLPVGIARVLRDLAGVDSAMEDLRAKR